jgi:hypothetical protein
VKTMMYAFSFVCKSFIWIFDLLKLNNWHFESLQYIHNDI